MKRKKLWLSLLLVAALLAAWFEPTRCVRGVLAGEPFYDGRPASWWAGEWENWCVTMSIDKRGAWSTFPNLDHLAANQANELCFARQPDVPFWEQFMELFQRAFQNRKSIQRTIQAAIFSTESAPPLLNGDAPAALPVLQSLENHESAKVRLFARYGIEQLRVARAQPAD